MTAALELLRRIAADPLPELTAIQTIEARIGRKLPPMRVLKETEPDTYQAVLALMKERIRSRRTT